MKNKKELSIYYEKKIQSIQEELKRIRRKLRWFSIFRLIVFLGILFTLFYVAGKHPFLSIFLLVLFSVLFGWLLRLYQKILFQKDLLSHISDISKEEIQRLQFQTESFDPGQEFINPSHSFAYDLDIFGIGSLFQYINRTITLAGRKTLADRLTHPLTNDNDIIQRQQAIRELSLMPEWRIDFMGLGRLFSEEGTGKESIQKWLNASGIEKQGMLIRYGRFFFPFLFFMVLLLSMLGHIFYMVPVYMFIANLFIVGFSLNKINQAHARVSTQFKFLQKYSRLLKHFEEQKFASDLLKKLQDDTGDEKGKASFFINQLSGIVNRFDYRLNLLAGILLNGAFLWDFHMMIALDKWKRKCKEKVPVWFRVIAELDAYISLAGLAFNRPEFVYAECMEQCILETQDTGHPLIPEETRVDNSFLLKKESEYHIITGANMAGKSTFLRTIGVNLVLAMTGAPVCARSFRFSPRPLFTSMRTSDSLHKQESYFHAELKRLKTLTDKLRQQEKLIVILDEILKGTNSKDKQEGSKKLLEQLTHYKGSGLIATHDLALGALEKQYPENIVNQCFEVEIQGKEVLFDYILRPGITTKMNATILMEQMGLIEG